VTIHNVPCKTSVRITRPQTESWTGTSTVWHKQWEYKVFGLPRQVFRVITLCGIASLFWCFGGMCSLHLQGDCIRLRQMLERAVLP